MRANDKNEKNYADQIDIWFKIFEYLDQKSLSQIPLVCQNFRDFSNLSLFKKIKNKANFPLDYTQQPTQINEKYLADHVLELEGEHLVYIQPKQLHCYNRRTKTSSFIPIDCKKIFSAVNLSEGLVAVGSDDNTVKLWQINDSKFKTTLKAHQYTVSALLVKKQFLISGSWDHNIIQWSKASSTDTEYKPTNYFNGHTSWVRALLDLPGDLFASAGNDKQILIWNTQQTTPHKSLSTTKAIYTLAPCKNQNYFISGNADGEIELWDWKNQIKHLTLKVHIKPVKFLLPLYDDFFVSASEDGTLKILSITSNIINIIHASSFNQPITMLMQLRNGLLLVGTKDRTIKLSFPELSPEKEKENITTITKRPE